MLLCQTALITVVMQYELQIKITHADAEQV